MRAPVLLAGRRRSVAPVLRTSGFEQLGGTTYTTPASTQVGDLVIAGRLSTSGVVQGMGVDFTAIGDTSAITCPYDINFGYHIAAAPGAVAHTIPIGGVATVYSVWQAGTFDPTTPVTDFLAFMSDHQSINWPAFLVGGNDHAVGGGWSNMNMVPGLPTGATTLAVNSATRYLREFYKQGGWAAQNVPHVPTGANGQVMTSWRYRIKAL
jgi:hypothetical protein